jgi:hypothetical protein
MNAGKIDIINKIDLSVYSEDQMYFKVFSINDVDSSLFMETFSDTEDLLSININQPFKRIVKFYNINDSVPMNFIEIDYSSMTDEQKYIFDDFVEKVNTLFNSLAP